MHNYIDTHSHIYIYRCLVNCIEMHSMQQRQLHFYPMAQGNRWHNWYWFESESVSNWLQL